MWGNVEKLERLGVTPVFSLGGRSYLNGLPQVVQAGSSAELCFPALRCELAEILVVTVLLSKALSFSYCHPDT